MSIFIPFSKYNFQNCIEISNISSNIFNKHLFFKGVCRFYQINNIRSENVFSVQNFQSIWNIQCLNYCVKKSLLVITTKVLFSGPKVYSGDFLELWESDFMKNSKKKGLIYIPFMGEIWDIKWYKSSKKTPILIICYGSALFFIDLPFLYPQFFFLSKGLCFIPLMNIYQWKIDSNEFDIVSGDIHGNIVIYNLYYNLSVAHVLYNLIQKIPISTVKIFPYNNNFFKKAKFIIASGYDGFVKIWDLNILNNSIMEISFPRRIVDISIDLCDMEVGTFWLGIENGFSVNWNIISNKLCNVELGNQGSTWVITKKSKYVFFLGEDGVLSFIKANFFSCRRIFSLTLEHIFFFNTYNMSLNWNYLQSIENFFCIKAFDINICSNGNYMFIIGGINGILCFYKYLL
nr:WD40 repeat-containing protein [Cryptomonas paramecium]